MPIFIKFTTKPTPMRYLVILLVLFATACKSGIQHSDIPVIDIEKNINNFRFVNLSEIAEDVKYIPLETKSNSLLRGISGLVVAGDRFIVHDFISCKAFDVKGRYICEIGNKGRGPGEYQLINKLSFNENEQKVYISSFTQLLEYTSEGAFIKEIPLPFGINEHTKNDYISIRNNIFCGLFENPNTESSLVFINEKGEIISDYPNRFNDPELWRTVPLNLILIGTELAVGERILFKSYLNDTVYSVNNELMLDPAYLLNSGKLNEIRAILKSIPDNDLSYQFDKQITIRNFFESHQYVLLECVFWGFGTEPKPSGNITVPPGWISNMGGQTQLVSALYDRQTQSLFFMKKVRGLPQGMYGMPGFVNDIDGGVPFWPTAQPYGNKLVCSINAYELKEYVQSDAFKNSKPKYPEKKKALKELADSLGWEDNPVLMLVTLK